MIQNKKIKLSALLCKISLFVFLTGASYPCFGDWPAYRGDRTRSGVSGETISPSVYLQWTYQPAHPPKPAWPMPASEMPRMHIDNAYHTVAADGKVFTGSSVTNEIFALDMKNGSICWTFFTQGPVRFAPFAYEGQIYAGSDDGYVYCLDADNGSLIWKYRAGPSEEKLLGNGRMISLWPVRSSVLVDQGTAYFAAGVFPYEGLYICALDANDGSLKWVNDTIGGRAHELQFGGISPHGYLLASDDVLYVPSGRSMPAAFDRKTGEFLFYASPDAKRGGVWALLDNDRLISGVDYSGTPHKVVYDAATGERVNDVFASVPGIDMVVTPGQAFIITERGIIAIDRKEYIDGHQQVAVLSAEQKHLSNQLSDFRKQLSQGNSDSKNDLSSRIDELVGQINGIEEKCARLMKKGILWDYPAKGFQSIVLAGNTLIAGGDEIVIGIDADTGKENWRNRIEGNAAAIAVSDGYVIVSSDAGPVYCFGENEIETPLSIQSKRNPNPYSNDEKTKIYQESAEKILSGSQCQKGYCLVLDCGEGRLAYELAKRSKLQIVGLESDPYKIKKARLNLKAAGLWGARVVVEPWDLKTLPDYFANLIVSDAMTVTGETASDKEERFRVLRPWGGTLMLCYQQDGKPSWVKSVRGELEGSGNWVQQYGDPSNTACSGDELVDGPLGMLWFGEPGPLGMVERHARAQSPIAMNGRLFMEGENTIMAVDAFNGSLLWKRNIPGAVRVKIKADSGNLMVTENGLYVAVFDKCYRLDPVTGETMKVYSMPPSGDGSPRRWGYITVADGILYGSAAEPMMEDYGAVLDQFLRNGQWREIDNIPEEFLDRYVSYKNRYPDPQDFIRATQRDGVLYRTMSAFGQGGEFTQKNAVTEGIMTSDKVFAIDVDTADFLWVHNGKKIANITLAIGGGKVFLAENAISASQRKQAIRQRRDLIQKGIYRERQGILDELEERKKLLAKYTRENRLSEKRTVEYLVESLRSELFTEEHPEGLLTHNEADVRIATALDAKTGKILWEKPVDLTGCCGDRMGAAYSKGMVFFYGNHGNHDAWRFRYGGMKWRRITALSAENGDMVWSRPLNYRTRPVIVGDQIILEPQACDLFTGETIMRAHPVTGEKVPWEFLRPGHTCGITAASANGLFYRSACTAFYDIEEDRGITLFGGYRPGCAISVIPACGVLLSQEAAAGCTCSYPIRCSLAMKRKPSRTHPWTIFITPGELKPVSHFAINLGAPADMKDQDGTVWLGYPNPKTNRYTHFPNYGVKFDLSESVLDGMGYFCRDHKTAALEGTTKPWLYTSGCIGLSKCRIPLIDNEGNGKTVLYSVRIGFKPLQGDREGSRVFDLIIQDRIVLENFDIMQSAGSENQIIVKEINDIQVEDDLVLEFVPKTPNPSRDQAPVVNFIEIIRNDDNRV